MRTKNFNLKKKIAFIASVTMIATTAAYLPAEVAQNIGIGSGIVASAAVNVNNTIDLFTVYIKVNGKYLAKNGKTYNTLNEIKTAQSNGDTNAEAVEINATDATGLISGSDAVFATTDVAATVGDDFTVADASDNKVVLPSNTPANAEIEVEVAGKESKTGVFFEGGTSSYTVTLDDRGTASFKKDSKIVAVDGDTAVKNTDGQYTDGDIENINFKNLKFEVASKTAPTGLSSVTAAFGSGSAAALGATNHSTNTVASTVKKVTTSDGDVYATVFTYTGVSGITPNMAVNMRFTTNVNWTASSNPSFSFGENGKATSGVVTFTSTTGEKEYFVYNFERAADFSDSDRSEIVLHDVTKTEAGTDTTKSVYTLGSSVAVEMTGKTVGESSLNSNYKIETDYKVIDNTYVTVFNVYTNNADALKLISIEDKDTVGKIVQQKDGAAYVDSSNTTEMTSHDNLIDLTDNTSAETPVLYYGASATGGKAFKVVINTEYTVPVEYDEENNSASYTIFDADKKLQDADAFTNVTGTNITKPETPTRPGYTFDGWYVGNNATGEATATKIFGSASSTIQNKASVTPNMLLVAGWTANKYTLNLDANGGFFPTGNYTSTKKYANGNAAESDYDVESRDGDDEATLLTVKTTAAVETESFLANIKNTTSGTNPFAVPTRNGYEFKGWALSSTAEATDAIDAKTYMNSRPTADNGSIKLYAIWKANENQVKFQTLVDGKDLDDYAAYGVSSYTGIEAYTATPASVNVSDVKVLTDGTISNLPTPTAKGKVFAGWYRAAVDKNDPTKVSGELVNSESIIDYDALDYNDAQGTDKTKITLYAKFNLETYNITYDLNGGDWESESDEDAALTTYTTATTAAQWTTAAPKKGSSFWTFKGWQINGDTSKTYSNANILAALKDKTGDVTLKAVYTEGNKSNGYIYLDLQKGSYYNLTSATDGKVYDLQNAQSELVDISGTKNSAILETISGDTITEQAATNTTYRWFKVARPGYQFTGWYADKECTTPYTFDKYPDGTEVTVYAGWKPLSTTRWVLTYNLVDNDGSLVNIYTTSAGAASGGIASTEGTKTYMGETGAIADAAEKEIIYDGKTYVFDATLSEGLVTKGEIKAAYKAIATKQDAVTSFEYDDNAYTQVKGVYKLKGTESKTLGTATNVAVKDGTVTWTAADNADHYRIQKTVNGKTYYGAKVTAAKATYTVPVEEHEIAVVAYNADESEKTVSTVVKVAASTKLGKATNVKCAEDGTVTFSAATGATKYQVAKVVNGKTYYSAKSDATSIKITPATEDYEVYVIAFDSTGKLSTHSETIKVSAAASTLEAVDDSTITVDGDGKVTWGAAKGAVAYKVFKITKNSEGKEVTNWGSKVTTTSYTFKHLPTTDFKVYVAAIDENGKVKYSAKKKISSLPSVTNVQLSADKKTVSWTAPTGTNADKIVKYQVAKFDTAANKTAYSVKVDAPATSITMKNAAVAGTKIFVLAFDADGNSSYSASIDVK